MCGIAGIFNLKIDIPIHKEAFEKALLLMYYRGPDAHATKVFDNNVILGHLRLSILDLDKENNQPFQIDNRYWIIFNGEIYNYIELRVELIAAGYSFRTTGDTEVLVRAYQHWGEDCVNKFNGMWAFAIYDEETNKLFCSRDRFGIKPFNYAKINGQFIFSSEIKAITSYFPELKIPNYNVIANYCRKSTGAQIKETWFKDIFRLEPAHNLVIDNSGINIYRYWDYPRKVDKKINFNDAVEKYRELLSDAVHLRMRSDVPVGFTLSSGLDSTSLVCLLKDKFDGNKNTYTAAFEKTEFGNLEKQAFKENIEINEPTVVKQVAIELGLVPTIIQIKYENYVDDLSKIIYHLESGHGSPAVIPLFQILNTAKNEVTVVLEGQGADEMLGGYINSALPNYFFDLLGHFKIRRAYHELAIFIKSYSLKMAFMTLIRQSDFGLLKRLYYKSSGMEYLFLNELKKYKEINDYPFEPKGFDNRLNKHLYKDHTGILVDLLHYGDAISMSQSLESRLPFMDYRLVEFAFRLPSEFKIKNGLGKYIHRIAMKGIVPDFILTNPIKLGFNSPLAHLFKLEGETSPKAILLSERCLDRKLFSKEALNIAFDEQKSGKKDHSRVLYRMLSVELWFREFIDNEESTGIGMHSILNKQQELNTLNLFTNVQDGTHSTFH
ncbi:MAG TPA: asparagine synthase (glutamine-hydrolyzing) [Hanamia sp.]